MRLYPRVLGADFERLPPVLQHFHTAPSGTIAQGSLQIRQGTSGLHRALARLLRLPAEGTGVPICLRVDVLGEKELWIRTFGTQLLTTTQWWDRGFLYEAVGPLHFVFRLSGDTEGMQFTCVRCTFLALPFPRPLSPRVEASTRSEGTGWWLSVRLFAPFLGLLMHYEGRLEPQQTKAEKR